MTVLLGLGTLAIGLAYVGLGMLSGLEVLQLRKVRGVSRFGIGFSLMAASCGPHHVVHAFHIFGGMDHGGALGIATVLGLPAGLVFVYLRVEAMLGRRGDRAIVGTPAWVAVVPLTFLVVAGGLVGWAVTSSGGLSIGGGASDVAALSMPMSADGSMAGMHHMAAAAPTVPGVGIDVTSSLFLTNLFVAITYSMVGWCLVRTQMRRRPLDGGWSLSGLSLAAVFPSCALMHLVYAFTAGGGPHMAFFDYIGVPASVYFLWVVYGVHRNSIVDWNRRPIIGSAAVPSRRSPWAVPARRA